MSTSTTHNETASKKQDCCVQVAVRVRPFVSKELIESEGSCIKAAQNKVVIGADKEFEFDRVIDQSSTQDEVYQSCMKDLLSKALEGYNATILAYGQTGSGKTYTMGTSNMNLNDESEMGIIPRVIRDIFSIRSEREKSVEMVLKISYFEIYNDNIIDLLDPNTITTGNQPQGKKGKGGNNGQNVFIREEQDGSINIYGITEEKVNSAEEMLAALERGGLCRSTSATLMNQTSSRSHAVFTIFLEQHGLEDLYGSNVMRNEEIEGNGIKQDIEVEPSLDEGFKTSKLHFVDLAGSERLKKTGAVGNTMKEGININMGLLSLGNVISALTEPSKNGAAKKHIPYRDSKLTRILQDSLGGNSNTLMVACVSPAESNFEESLNSLKYASRARRIKNKPIVNRDPQSAIISALKQQIQESHFEINKLRQILTENNIAVPKGIAGGQGFQDVEGNRRPTQDVLMMKQNGQLNSNILGITTEVDTEELKNLRINQVRLEKKIKELLVENGQLKSHSYKGEIGALVMQKERDELRLKLEKIMKIAKEKGINLVNSNKSNAMEVEVTGDMQESDSLAVDIDQKSLVDEYFANAEKMKKELQDKEKAFRELQCEFEDGIKASLRDQQMLVEREKKIAVLTRNLKNAELESKKAKEEIKIMKQDASKTTNSKNSKQQLTRTRTNSIESDEDDSAELEKMATDPELVQMESVLKIEENHQIIKLSKVDGSIKETSEKMRKLNSDQLELQQQLLAKMKEQYHSKINTLEADMRRIEHQRDEALQKMTNNNSKEAIAEKQKVIETFKNKVNDMQSVLGEYQKKAREQDALSRKVSNQEKQISTLGSEITKFKALKITLYKEMKKNNDEFEKFKAQKYKDIMLEKKKNIDKEKQIFKLKNQTRVQERILIKRQEDIKKLIKSRDLIKKIMSSSAGNKPGKKQKNKLPKETQNSEQSQLEEEDVLDQCLCSLIQSIELGIAIEKHEKDINFTLQEIESSQQKQIEFKLEIEKSQRELDERISGSSREDGGNILIEETTQLQQAKLEQQKMELEEMSSRLESLESKYDFLKSKIAELNKDSRKVDLHQLQEELLSSQRFSNLPSQKILLKALLDRFGASSLEFFRQAEKLEETKIHLEDSNQTIVLLRNQKDICQLQLQQQIDYLSAVINSQQQQLQASMNPDHSDSDSEENAPNMHQNYFKDPDNENPSRRFNKNRMSPPKIISSMRYKSLRYAQQIEQSPFKKVEQPDQIKLLSKQNNDLTRQLKQNEIRLKTLQHRNETLNQKYEDLKKATCKDKFIGINKATIEDDQPMNALMSISQPILSSAAQQQQMSIQVGQTQVQGTSTALGYPQPQQIPTPSKQFKETAGITSLRDRRREVKGKAEVQPKEDLQQHQLQAESNPIEFKGEKNLSLQYAILDRVTNSESTTSAMAKKKIPPTLSQKRAQIKEAKIKNLSLNQTSLTENSQEDQGTGEQEEKHKFSFGHSQEIIKSELNLQGFSTAEQIAKASIDLIDTLSQAQYDNSSDYMISNNEISLGDSENLTNCLQSNQTKLPFRNSGNEFSGSIGMVFGLASARNSQESNGGSQNTSFNFTSPCEDSFGMGTIPPNGNVKFECVGKINEAHGGQIFCVESHENFLFSTSVKTLKIWDLETLKNISDIQAHTHFVKGLAILEEQKWIATACDKYINIWDMISMQKVCSLTGHNVDIKQLYMDNNHVLYSAGKGLNNYGALVTWDIRKQSVIEEREKNQDIFSVLPYKSTIYYGSRDHYVRRINTENNLSMDPFQPPHYDVVTSLAILNGYLVSGSKDHNLKLWNINNQSNNSAQFKSQTYYSNEQLLALKSNKDKNLLFVGQKDGKIKVLTTQNNKFKEVSDIVNGLQSVNCISNVQNQATENMFVCGTSDKVIKIWKPTADSYHSLATLKQQAISSSTNENYNFNMPQQQAQTIDQNNDTVMETEI